MTTRLLMPSLLDSGSENCCLWGSKYDQLIVVTWDWAGPVLLTVEIETRACKQLMHIPGSNSTSLEICTRIDEDDWRVLVTCKMEDWRKVVRSFVVVVRGESPSQCRSEDHSQTDAHQESDTEEVPALLFYIERASFCCGGAWSEWERLQRIYSAWLEKEALKGIAKFWRRTCRRDRFSWWESLT